MADKKNAQVLTGEQLSLAVLPLSGSMVASGGKIDTTCLVDTANGQQLAYKVFNVNGGGGASMEWVTALPAVGEPNTMYLVPSGNTREGYAVFQQFVWNATDQEWVAMGAFDTTIVQQGLVYEQSFETATNTWTVRVNQSAN